jgi:hypothetical protein
MRRPISHSALALYLLLLLGVGACGGGAPKLKTMRVAPPDEGVDFPKIIVGNASAGSIEKKHAFTFEGKRYELVISLDKAVLEGARASDKKVRMTHQVKEEKWRPGLQWALITDAALDPMYNEIIRALKKIRRQQRLDDDRYAELTAVFVQSFAYCSEPGQPPKYPIETIGDGCGDCDDKSRLLAGLLLREGFGAALFFFQKEKHMAVGIRSTGDGFMGSGYAYIETTSPSYIGFPSYEYSEVKLTSTPEVMLLGDNVKAWTKGKQVAFLHETLNAERARAETLNKALAAAREKNAALKTEYDTLAKALHAEKKRLPPKEYNRKVDEANRAANRFNDAVDAYNALVREVNRSGAIVKHIFGRPDDRHGVYEWVQKKLSK